MTKREIMNRIIENHNRIIHVTVSGENTILIADTIRSLRELLSELQSDINDEEMKNSK